MNKGKEIIFRIEGGAQRIGIGGQEFLERGRKQRRGDLPTASSFCRSWLLPWIKLHGPVNL